MKWIIWWSLFVAFLLFEWWAMTHLGFSERGPPDPPPYGALCMLAGIFIVFPAFVIAAIFLALQRK